MKHPALFFLFLFAFSVPTFNLNAAEIDPPFKQGEELLDGWHIAQAEDLAAKALRENPKSAAALEFDGRVKFYQGKYQEALKSLDQALAIVKASGKQDMARRFVNFILGDEGQAILQQYGYSNPSAK